MPDKITLGVVVLLILALVVACIQMWAAAQRTLREHDKLQEALKRAQFKRVVYPDVTEPEPPHEPTHYTDAKPYDYWRNKP